MDQLEHMQGSGAVRGRAAPTRVDSLKVTSNWSTSHEITELCCGAETPLTGRGVGSVLLRKGIRKIRAWANPEAD